MKPANGFGLALAAAAMVAAMAQTAAASGSIRSITTCDPETGHREYGPNDPVRIGEALAFKVRLLNFNTNCTSTGGTDNPWRFRPRPGVDEALAAANPPAMGLWIGGRKRCATIRSVQPSLSYYTDLVFEYVVQSGDQAQPVRFCNVDGSGPLADSAGQLYPLENVGPGSCWVLTDEATGTSCEFSFGSEALVPSSNDGFAYPPAGWSASGEVRDYDLSRAGIYVNGFKDIAATVTGCAVPYDGQGHGVTVAVSDPDDGAALRFARGTLSGPTDAWSETAPMFTNACDATVWVEIAAEGYATVTNHADVTITNAPLTIAAKDQAYAYNGQTQGEGDTAYATPGDLAEKVAVSGLAPGDGLASIILDGQATDPGTYPLVPSDATVTNAVGANVTDNYAIGYTNGTLTIREPLPFVSNVVARQRWPWNGLVDVDYEVGGTTTGLVTRISFAEQGGAGRSWVATNFLAGAEPSVEPGFHRATWDTAADGATNVVAAKVTATVELVREPPVSDGNVWSLIGDFNSWGGDVDMTLTDGKWVSPVTKITAGGFKIRFNHDWTENVGGVMEALGIPFAAISGGDNISIEEGNDYVVTYDPDERTILVEVIGWGVVGTINSWGGSADLAMKEENGMFVRKNVTLAAHDEIKVRYRNSWDVNYGGRTDVGFAVEAISGGDNLEPGAGTYDIWLDAEKKALFVMKAGEAPKYWGVVGTINGWGGTPDAVMYHDAEGYFVAKGIALAADDEIKIRKNSDWTDNRGASYAAPDTALDAVSGGDNIKVAAGTYYVYYQSASEKIYVMTAGETPADAQ